MTEDEWNATGQGAAANAFVETTLALAMVLASAELGAILTDQLGPLAELVIRHGKQLGGPPAAVDELRANQKYLDMLKPGLARAVRSSLIVIGACSAIEAYLEQFVKARIREEPTIVDGTDFDCTTVAQQKSLTDADEILEEQWRAIKRLPNKGLRRQQDRPPPHESFEIILATVNRRDVTPSMVEEHVNTAYVIRNVWAHNAGYADSNFQLKAPPQLSVKLGDLVDLSREDAQRYLSMIMTYGMIVANRERAQHGLGPIPMAGKPGDSEWGRAYNEMYADRA